MQPAIRADPRGRAPRVVNRTILDMINFCPLSTLITTADGVVKRVAKPACLSIRQAPFLLTVPDVTAPYADTSEAPGSLLAPGADRADRCADRLRPGKHLRPAAGPPAARPGRGRLPAHLRRQAVRQGRRPPELAACLDYLRPGDTLVVPSLDRLSRSLADLTPIVATLRRRGVGFQSLHEALDTTTPGGRLVFHVFAALAEFIRELIVEGTREGLDAARARGVRLERPPAMTAEQIRHARDLLTRPGNTVSSIARLLGVSRATIYKYLPELGTGTTRQPGRSRRLVPGSRPGWPSRQRRQAARMLDPAPNAHEPRSCRNLPVWPSRRSRPRYQV